MDQVIMNLSVAAIEKAEVINQPSKVPVKKFRVDFRSESDEIKAGALSTLNFTVKGETGGTVRDLQIVHEKPMHLLAVSRDLQEFYHLHPELQADGSYQISHIFPNGGDYLLYVDFTPQNMGQVVERIELKVAGQPREKVKLVPDQTLEKFSDNLRIVMKQNGEIKAGRELMLDFQVFDKVTGKPVTDLQKYLGELAHFVIISEDLQDFVHAHPMSKGLHHSMMNMPAGGHHAHGHCHHACEVVEAARESEVSAHVAFPRHGLYKIWAQFQRGGQVITVSFVVKAAS